MNNIVIFGPTQVGKTTIAGYLSSYYLTSYDFDRESQKIKRLINAVGVDFKKEMILPSFISMDKDELRSYARENTIGTTKRVHRTRITIPTSKEVKTNNYTCIFIDTPGTHAKVAEKYRGLFEGDVGLYVINAIDVEKMGDSYEIGSNQWKCDKERYKYLEPLRFWFIYKNPSRLIIILSKVDGIKYDLLRIKKCINKINDMIRYVCTINSLSIEVPIIPTAIRVNEKEHKYYRIGYNIVNHDSWEFGCVIDELSRITPQPIQNLQHSLAYIDRVAQIKGQKNHYALRIKALNGSFSVGDSIILGPVSYRDTALFLRGEIESLKLEKDSLVETLFQGQIGGVKLTSVLRNEVGNRLTKNKLIDFKMLKTTILAKSCDIRGNCLSIAIRKDEVDTTEWQAICSMYPKAQIPVFWLGRKISLNMVGKHIYEDRAELMLMFLTPDVERSIVCFTLPNEVYFSSLYRQDITIVIQWITKKERKRENYERRYVRARVINIIELRRKTLCLKITIPNDDYSPILNGPNFENTNVFYSLNTGTNIQRYFNNIESLSSGLKIYRSLFKELNITDFCLEIAESVE